VRAPISSLSLSKRRRKPLRISFEQFSTRKSAGTDSGEALIPTVLRHLLLKSRSFGLSTALNPSARCRDRQEVEQEEPAL